MSTGQQESTGTQPVIGRQAAGAAAAAVVMRPGVTLMATCLGLFLGQVDTTAINLALPAIRHDLAGDLGSMQWVVDAYNVTFAALLLTGGTLGDRFGRRRLFRCGVTVFVLGSLLCAVAGDLPLLLGGRVLQGMGSGMMLPQSLAILATAFPGRRERNRAMAAWSIVAGTGLAAGPTLGGLVVQTLGWSFIFWVNIPLGLAALLLTFRHVPESRNPQARTLDLPGQLLAAVTLGTLTFLAVDGHHLGWTSATTLGCAALCAAGLAGFLWAERRHPSPMLPLSLLRRGQLPVASIVAMCMTFGMYGLFMLISLAFQQERGTSALMAGVEMLPLPVVFTLLSPTVGRLVTRHGPRLPMTAGMTLMGSGLLIYALAGPDADLAVTELAFVVVGIGLALNTGPVVGVAVSAVAPEYAGLASGIANLSRMFGATLGVAVQGTVLAVVGRGASHGPQFVSGLRAAILVGCAVEFLGALVAFWGVARVRTR
ncbi:MFS transporter [Kitasatospora nipponensis]|uniref:MFS transporter n=1 Tax=Kitasatospora nipponensis TaxID=258049 RepID=A0ABN1WEV4_9ACTN